MRDSGVAAQVAVGGRAQARLTTIPIVTEGNNEFLLAAMDLISLMVWLHDKCKVLGRQDLLAFLHLSPKVVPRGQDS